MGKQERVSRRYFLRLSAMATAGVVLAACGGNTNQANNGGAGSTATKTVSGGSSAANQNTPNQLNGQSPPTEVATAAQPTGGGSVTAVATQGQVGGPATAQAPAPTLAVPKSFKESPELTKMVQAGKLPKAADRLPKHPMVLKPVERIGAYGGTWTMGILGPNDATLINRVIGFENLVHWKVDTRAFSVDEIIPNVAESFDFNDQGTEYTFKLREGMKWSDGKPFTADDIMFWYEDIYSNKELTPDKPSWLTSGDKPVKVEKQDDNTVVFKFAVPNGLFLQKLAGPSGGTPINYPAHYLKQFHKKYNPKVVQEAKKEGLDNWIDLFFNKTDYTENPELPVLNAWIMTSPVGKATQQVTAKRNPYYWKVDTEGNQLPYIDNQVYRVISKAETMVLDALNGEIDMQTRTIATLQNKPLFYKNQKRGDYHFYDTIPEEMNQFLFAVNLTVKDPVKRKVFNNKDFRIGLSYAINRKEVINVVFQGQGEPWQAAPRPQSPFYNERLAKQYTEYDVKKANEHLDKALPKKDSQGRRLGPDGKPFSFTFLGEADVPAISDVAQLLEGYFKEVGVTMATQSASGSLASQRWAGNEFEASARASDAAEGGLAAILDPRWYFPTDMYSSLYGVPWTYWYNDPKDPKAVEPPSPTKKQIKLYRQLETTADSKKQAELMKQILDIAADQFYAIGISLIPKGYGIQKNNFHNVPSPMLQAWVYPTPSPTNPPQYFIEQSK